MSFSDYLENKLLDHLHGKASYTAPTIYVGLSKADPGEDGSGVSEPSGGAYARVSTAAGDWSSASGGVTQNANAITFPTPTGEWGVITHIFRADAASGGNVLDSAALDVPKTIASGSDAPEFAAGDISITLT